MIGRKKTDDEDWAGMVFVGCILIGLGLGFLFDQIVVGTILGVGVGFLAMAAASRK